VEFDEAGLEAAQIDVFTQTLDERLCRSNDDYRAHRSGGFGLRPPLVVVVRRGTFAAWMKQRGQLGGQHKVPRVIGDQALFGELQRFASERSHGTHG
jgi:hypothetical protein